MLDPERLIGLIIDDQYHLKAVKGIGAFGVVYASDVVADGRVLGEAAVKLLWPPDDRSVDAMRAEVQAMNQLQHAHLIAYKSSGQVTDGKASGAIYIAMDLAADSLAILLASGKRLSEAAGLTLCKHIGSALGYLEQRGAIHCDVKPANVLRVGKAWKLGDFGLVRGVQADGGSPGTPRYKAPEALTKPGARSDIWSLGVVVQEAMTGEFPYEGETEIQLMAQLLTAEPRVSDRLPPSVRTIVQGCLTKDPDRRWSAQRVLDEIAKTAEAMEAARRQPPAAPQTSGKMRGGSSPVNENRPRQHSTVPASTPEGVVGRRASSSQPEVGAPAVSSGVRSGPQKAVTPASPAEPHPVLSVDGSPGTLTEFRRRLEQLRGADSSLRPEATVTQLTALLEQVRERRPAGGGSMFLGIIGAIIGGALGGPVGAIAGGGLGAAVGSGGDQDDRSAWDQLVSEIEGAIAQRASPPSAAPLSRTACPHCGADLRVWRDSTGERCAKCKRKMMSS